ncbi:MAG: hypothetical protein ACQETB_07875 [Halobacteriota archaeon]
MGSEDGAVNATDGTIGDRILGVLNSIHRSYRSIEGTARNYTPRIVRTLEVVLALVLFAFLGRWFYMYLVVG